LIDPKIVTFDGLSMPVVVKVRARTNATKVILTLVYTDEFAANARTKQRFSLLGELRVSFLLTAKDRCREELPFYETR
jgi:hypothetical protein